jgi:Kae1-associated kinase Bud32
MKQLISQGAEAKIFLTKDKIVKDRIPKGYRHPQLDTQIRRRRTKSEAKILTKALETGIGVPQVLNTEKHKIEIQFIEGDRLSETLNNYTVAKQFKTMQQLGTQVSKLHKNNIIHGDLTTSNTILSNDKLFIIDFGLGFISTKIEDKAVDLHLIKQALEAKHFQNHKDLFNQFLKTYKDKEIIQRLEVVEKRGRYKH